MRIVFASAALALAAALPVKTVAEDLSLSWGFSIVSEYVSDGFELSDGTAVQPYIELGYSGFFAGIWASNGDEDLLFADTEVDYYLGYRGQAGSFYYGARVEYFTFQDDLGVDDYEEYLVNVGYLFNDRIYGDIEWGHAPDFDQDDILISAEYYTNVPGLTLAVGYGDSSGQFGDWNYWSIGGSYAFTDNISVDLTWHDANEPDSLGTTDGILVGTVSFEF